MLYTLEYLKFNALVEAQKQRKGNVFGMGLFANLGAGFKRDELEDATLQTNRMLVHGFSDADYANNIERVTGKDIRDQLSLEEVEELADEAILLGMGHRRN